MNIMTNKISRYCFVTLLSLVAAKSNNLNKCEKCKIIVKSFNYWLENTSNGKHEGGDASWEESKLKRYSNSELRFVDIHDNLCSELKSNQDQCYALVGEIEQSLFRYWSAHDTSIDLHKWLCIDELKYCCYEKHYGEFCNSCPIYSEKVCSGNGECDGDGTREGQGTCICKNGYSGVYCEKCSVSFYQSEKGVCKPCHKSCYMCHDDTEYNCEKCQNGWENISGTCLDIDECRDPNVCPLGKFCINSEGSFSCHVCDSTCKTCNGAGVTNCVTCPLNRTLWGSLCVDESSKDELITNALRKLALYIGMVIISCIIFRHVENFASLVVVVVALYIYISEKMLPISSFKVFYYAFLS